MRSYSRFNLDLPNYFESTALIIPFHSCETLPVIARD